MLLLRCSGLAAGVTDAAVGAQLPGHLPGTAPAHSQLGLGYLSASRVPVSAMLLTGMSTDDALMPAAEATDVQLLWGLPL